MRFQTTSGVLTVIVDHALYSRQTEVDTRDPRLEVLPHGLTYIEGETVCLHIPNDYEARTHSSVIMEEIAFGPKTANRPTRLKVTVLQLERPGHKTVVIDQNHPRVDNLLALADRVVGSCISLHFQPTDETVSWAGRLHFCPYEPPTEQLTTKPLSRKKSVTEAETRPKSVSDEPSDPGGCSSW